MYLRWVWYLWWVWWGWGWWWYVGWWVVGWGYLGGTRTPPNIYTVLRVTGVGVRTPPTGTTVYVYSTPTNGLVGVGWGVVRGKGLHPLQCTWGVPRGYPPFLGGIQVKRTFCANTVREQATLLNFQPNPLLEGCARTHDHNHLDKPPNHSVYLTMLKTVTNPKEHTMSATRIIAGDPSRGSFAYFSDNVKECMNCSMPIEYDEVVVEDLVTICLGCAIELHGNHPLSLRDQGLDNFIIYCGQVAQVLKEHQELVLSLHGQVLERTESDTLEMDDSRC